MAINIDMLKLAAVWFEVVQYSRCNIDICPIKVNNLTNFCVIKRIGSSEIKVSFRYNEWQGIIE